MDGRIHEVRPLYGPRPVAQRRDRRQSGGAFDEAMAGDGDAGGEARPAEEPPTTRRLQPQPEIGRRQDDDGLMHVDILV